ncbi:hypothetical protein EBZ39_05220 [bacterium]|nr:hypothetical protein [bacterium]
MSILEGKGPVNEVTPATRTATQIKMNTRATYQQLLSAYSNGLNLFWRNTSASPSAISAALGTDAKEIFELHGMIGELIAKIRPQDIEQVNKVIGEFTYNADGTVTIKPKTLPTTPSSVPVPPTTPAQ